MLTMHTLNDRIWRRSTAQRTSGNRPGPMHFQLALRLDEATTASRVAHGCETRSESLP